MLLSKAQLISKLWTGILNLQQQITEIIKGHLAY